MVSCVVIGVESYDHECLVAVKGSCVQMLLVMCSMSRSVQQK